jgi:4-amino-4-deoxy-L-arabinose transferase-like glycosyltransferase
MFRYALPRIATTRYGEGGLVAQDRVVVGWREAALFALAQALLWSLAFTFTYKAPALDGAEQFVWAFSLENGYWKHPPLPSWILHGLMQLFGPSLALSFVTTQIGVTLALLLTWRLGCQFMSPRRSLIAMALTSLVDYHTIGADSFNHNTALLPFQAAMVLAFYRASREGQWRWWAAAGLTAGLATLVKYVALLPIAGLLAAFAVDRAMHCRRQLLGLALAFVVFAIVLTPHAIWLQQTDFLPFHYARAVAQPAPGFTDGMQGLFDFVLIQMIRALPLLIGVAIVMSTRPSDGGSASLERSPAPSRRDTRFLWIAGLSPIALTLAVGLLTNTTLQSRWGANAFLLSGWLAMSALSRPDTPAMLRRCLRFTAVSHLVLCLGFTLSKTVLSEHLQRRTRANFPGAVLAQSAQSTWRAHTSAPLRVVVSDIWLGGNLVANNARPLAVLIDGHHLKSPWVKEQAVTDCGALVLDDQTADAAGHGEPHPALDALMRRADVTGTWELPWAAGPQHPGGSGEVRWGIILPAREGACTLR